MTTQKSFELLSDEVRNIAADLGLKDETLIQNQAIPAILKGENVLIIAPTGSGKTEAAMLPIFHMINEDKAIGGIRALYVTPLRALNRDMLSRLERWAYRLNISIEVRHGDTAPKERRKQSFNPPDILITTPETLQAVLMGTRLRAQLKGLRWVVIDEIHQLAADRRGSQLSIALERIRAYCKAKDFQRIGISATISNKEEVGSFLVGSQKKCTVVDASATKKDAEYNVEFIEPTPEDDLKSRELFVTPQTMARMSRIADLVSSHERTLIFVNSRTNAETLASRFRMLGLDVAVHHGSLPREEREGAERRFKEGNVKALICTSTMELGIDIGEVDLTIQYMSPRQVNSMIQRVGRSGHSLSKSSEGIVLAVSPEDVLESIIICKEAKEKNLEPIVIHTAPLDVLAHQVAGLLMSESEVQMEEALTLIRGAYPFRVLSKDQFMSVVNYMQKLGYLGIFGSTIFKKAKCRDYYIQNLSMIPDERRYNVVDLSSSQKIGILGEEFMLLHAKVGTHFIIKGKVWQIEEIQGENVYVTPYQDPTAAVPGWDGELLPIPKRIAQLVGAERGRIELVQLNPTDAERVGKTWPSDRSSRLSVVKEIANQSSAGVVPADSKIVIEKFDRFVIVHTSAGDRINDTLGEFFEETLLREGLIRHWWSDGYRILIELTTDELPVKEISSKLLRYEPNTEGFIKAVIRKHFPFGYYMKFIAERFGALKRGLMLSEQALKELTVKFRFTPIYEETLREAELTKIDLQGSIELLKNCHEHKIEVHTFESHGKPSPLALYIMNRYAEFESGDEQSNTVESMKASIEKEVTNLLCFSCGNLKEFLRIGDLVETPICDSCGSGLLSVVFYGARYAHELLSKRKQGRKLSGEEADFISKARRSADVVLAYGKRGVIAQSVYGVGPQTAAKILSKMQVTEEELYNDLMQAKLKFIQTKPFWD